MFVGVAIAAFLALPLAGLRAFRFRIYMRFVAITVGAMIAVANLVQVVRIPDLDAYSGCAIVAVAALFFALARSFVRKHGQSFGSAILSPVTGRVVGSSDGQLDHRAPLRVTEDPAPLGNHVVIDSGRGVVFLRHLQNGSVMVRPDDVVDVGTPIGRCGNSGRTSRPHLHIHAQDLVSYAFDCARGIPIAFQTPNGPIVLGAAASLVDKISTAI